MVVEFQVTRDCKLDVLRDSFNLGDWRGGVENKTLYHLNSFSMTIIVIYVIGILVINKFKK